MKKLLLMGMLLTMVSGLHAVETTDVLKVADVELKAGEQKKIAIELVNPEHKYTAFQFDLKLPEGISIATNNKGKLVASLDEERMDDHVFSVAYVEDAKVYRFVSYSMSAADFYESQGALVWITLKAADDIASGSLQATLTSIQFTTSDNTQYDLSESYFNITSTSGINEISAEKPATVYDLKGNQIRKNATSVEGLAKGVYIINNKKVIVK